MVAPRDYLAIQRCVSAGDFAGAEAVCAQIAENEGTNPSFWQVRGDVALMAGKWAEAESHYRWTTTLYPQAPLAWLGLARACIHAGRHQIAANAALHAQSLGLSEGNAVAAQEVIAHAKFAGGDLEGGRSNLAALLPGFLSRLAQAQENSAELLSRALPAALCARDAVTVERILKGLYPHAGELSPIAIGPTATIEDWCGGAGIACKVLDPPRKVRLEPTTPYGRRYSYTTDPILFASIPGGEWMPGWDFAIAPDGTVLENSGYFKIAQVFNHAPHAYFPEAKLVGYRSSPHVEYIDDDVLLVSAPGHGHIGHWLIDFMPRLAGRGYMGSRHPKIALPADLTGRKYRDMLALAGVRDEDIVRCRPDRRYRFRTLHVFRPGRSMPPHPANVQYLRDILRGDAPAAPRREKPKRLFLSREKIGTRLALNAAEVDGVLREFGFTTVNMGDLTVVEQRALLADADVLLGAVGSDLLALYFAPPGCTVISIQFDQNNDPCVPPAAVMLGMKHQFLLCPVNRPSRNPRHGLDRDFVVDCGELRSRLQALDR